MGRHKGNKRKVMPHWVILKTQYHKAINSPKNQCSNAMQFQNCITDLGQELNKQVLNLYRRTKGKEQPKYFRKKKMKVFFFFNQDTKKNYVTL